MQQAQLRMKQGDKEASKKLLEEGKGLLDECDGADAVVHAKYYEAKSQFHKVGAVVTSSCSGNDVDDGVSAGAWTRCRVLRQLHPVFVVHTP